jgi:hypothetical protein
VYTVWLDLREKKMQVWGAGSKDGGATWDGEKRIYASPDGSVCECCQPQATFDPKGGLHVMWRNQLSGARDMYLAASKDGGRTFGEAVKLGEGTWKLDRCPMDGGGLAGDGGEVETIWRREGEVFRARPGRPEVSLGKGEQGWAAAGEGGVYLAWTEGRPGVLKALRPGSDKPLSLARDASDPVVAASPTGKGPVVAVWEEGKEKDRRLRAAVLSGPE